MEGDDQTKRVGSPTPQKVETPTALDGQRSVGSQRGGCFVVPSFRGRYSMLLGAAALGIILVAGNGCPRAPDHSSDAVAMGTDASGSLDSSPGDQPDHLPIFGNIVVDASTEGIHIEVLDAPGEAQITVQVIDPVTRRVLESETHTVGPGRDEVNQAFSFAEGHKARVVDSAGDGWAYPLSDPQRLPVVPVAGR